MGGSGKKPVIILLLTWLSWFWSHGTRVGIPAITPFLRQRFVISTSEAAAIPGILNLGFYVFTFFSGKLPLKIGYKKAVTLAALGAGLATTAAALFNHVSLFYAAILVTGIFLSMHLPSAIPWLGQLFKGPRQGFFIGIHESAAPAGQTIGPIVLALLFTAFTYNFSLTFWALIPIVAGFILLFITVNPKDSAKVSREIFSQQAKRLKTLHLTVLTIANLVGNLGVVAIIPLHLVDTFKLEKSFVAIVVGVSRLLGVVGQPLGGYLHDRYGFLKVASAVTSLNLFSNIYLMLAPYNFLYLFVMAVQATATAMYFPVVYSYLVKNYGPSSSRILGKIFSAAGLAGPVSAPILAGFLAERFNYTVALAYPTALAFAGMLSLLPLKSEK